MADDRIGFVKILVRYRRGDALERTGRGAWWYITANGGSSCITDAHDFAPGCDYPRAVMKAVESSADINLLLTTEIIMLREEGETIIDPENGMQMLALAALE